LGIVCILRFEPRRGDITSNAAIIHPALYVALFEGLILLLARDPTTGVVGY
jgi:hypothetical protein